MAVCLPHPYYLISPNPYYKVSYATKSVLTLQAQHQQSSMHIFQMFRGASLRFLNVLGQLVLTTILRIRS